MLFWIFIVDGVDKTYDVDLVTEQIYKKNLINIANKGVMSTIRVLPNTFVVIDHEIFSSIILHLSLIQEMLSVTSKGMCAKYW